MTNTTQIQEAKQNLEKRRLALAEAIEVQSQLDNVERNLRFLSQEAQLKLNVVSARDIAIEASQYAEAIRDFQTLFLAQKHEDRVACYFTLTKGGV